METKINLLLLVISSMSIASVSEAGVEKHRSVMTIV